MFAARSFAITLAMVMSYLAAAESADVDRSYKVTGRDSFSIGSRDLRGDVTYDGTQTLAIARSGKNVRYSAKVAYLKIDQGAAQRSKAEFVSLMLPSGEQRDERNGDPDYLTVLNQPFSVQLDAPTIRDVSRLAGSVPFTFPSPMTGAALRGGLRHIGDSIVAGQRAIGIAFDARGPMRGSLPDHPEIALSGTIRMSGVAYYTYNDALLLSLDATLRISGNLADRASSDPVTIVYRRTIKASEVAPISREAKR